MYFFAFFGVFLAYVGVCCVFFAYFGVYFAVFLTYFGVFWRIFGVFLTLLHTQGVWSVAGEACVVNNSTCVLCPCSAHTPFA